jgi:hypothetical protein
MVARGEPCKLLVLWGKKCKPLVDYYNSLQNNHKLVQEASMMIMEI